MIGSMKAMMPALALILALMPVPSVAQNVPPPAQQTPPAVQESYQVEDVVVTAQRRTDMARAFVGRIAAPARGRGLGRWLKICPGIANLDRTVAQPMVDQMAIRAIDLGIEVEEPGCVANIIVVFSTDAGSLTRALIEAEPEVFRGRGGGIDRGEAAFRVFRDTDLPVRWWTLSVPIDSETGQRAVRVPGDLAGGPNPRLAAALGCGGARAEDCVGVGVPIIQSAGGASRLNSQIVDQIYKSIIIVDIDAVAGLNAVQMGDYLAMVALAQIELGADTAAFDTVLNLFSSPQAVSGMTDWDQSYLTALYASQSRSRNPRAQAGDVAAIMNNTPRAPATEPAPTGE